MWIRNNSTRSWPNYNCGDEYFFTVPAKATFEVSDEVGEFLLKNLGSANWLVKTQEPQEVQEVKARMAAQDALEEKEKAKEIVKEVLTEQKVEAKPQEKAPFCDSCDSKGVRHKKTCPTNSIESAVDSAGEQKEATE